MNDFKIEPKTIEEYLHGHIPISRAMGISVVKAAPLMLELKAPLNLNINHRESVFGGSASAVAILSAWSLIHSKLLDEKIESRLVIRKNTMRYIKPILKDFNAVCKISEEKQWNTFIKILQKKGIARIRMKAHLACDDEIVAEFEGEYVAVRRDKVDDQF